MKFSLYHVLVFGFFTFSVFSQDDIYDIARNGCLDDIKLIIKDYPETVNYKNSKGFTPLTIAAYSGNLEVVSELVKHVKDLDVDSRMGTPLMAAAFKGNIEVCKVLLDSGADPNASDLSGTTALHYAVRFTNKKIIKLLVENNADIYLTDGKGYSPIEYAVQDKDEEIIKLLKKEKL
jgi:ankyrin repeat protein